MQAAPPDRVDPGTAAWLLDPMWSTVRRLAIARLGLRGPGEGDGPQVADEPWVRALLDAPVVVDGRAVHPYVKWGGAHWRLVTLAELDVEPDGDPRLADVVDAALPRIGEWLGGPGRLRRARPVDGRVRMCASMDGNAAWAAIRLGRGDHPLVSSGVERLLEWQWPDGGWNCDRKPGAAHASFNESFAPLRALAARGRVRDALGGQARAGAERAAAFLLVHRVDRSHRTGEIAHAAVDRACWPPYWHYDRLIGLRALHEAGRLDDPRCAAALDALRAARGADGRWEPGARHWRGPGSAGSNVEVVAWGREGERRMLTLLALEVLLAA